MTATPPNSSGRLRKWTLFAAVLAVALALAELWSRSSGIDGQLLQDALYYQDFLPDLHQSLPDSPLHYRLRAGQAASGVAQRAGRPWAVHIGPRGSRAPEPAEDAANAPTSPTPPIDVPVQEAKPPDGRGLRGARGRANTSGLF